MKTGFGHLMTGTFCCSFVLLPLVVGQQSTVTPKKVLTPEQMAFRQQWKEYEAKKKSLEAQAKQVFDTEMAREKAEGQCPDAHNTHDIKICEAEQTAITDQNLKSYEELLHELMAPAPRMPGAPAANPPGPAGLSLSDEELLAEFDRTEQSWRIYREAACTAVFHRFHGGTLGPYYQMACKQSLARDHMRVINMIYNAGG
jgi:hypothetical protein